MDVSNEEKAQERAAQILHLEGLIEREKKHLSWYDYQTRGGRWSDKTDVQVAEGRKEITDHIKEMQDELRGLHNG